MTAIHRYFANRVLGIMRAVVILITVSMALYLLNKRRAAHIFPSHKPKTGLNNNSTGLVLPAQCFIDHPNVNHVNAYNNFTASPWWLVNNLTSSNASAAIATTAQSGYANFDSDDTLDGKWDLIMMIILLLAMIGSIGTSYYQAHMEKESETKSYRKHVIISRTLCCGVAAGITIYAAVTLLQLRTWMNSSSKFDSSDAGEISFESYGQLMPLFLLVLPISAFVEALFGMSVHFHL